MKRFFHQLNQFLSSVCGWLMFSMMALLILDIVSRSISKPFQFIAELSVFVMIAAIYLGLARCEEHREHVRLELFLQRLKGRPRKIVEQVVYLVELATVGVMLYAVVLDAIVSFRTNEAVAGTVQMPIWPVKFIMVIGLFFYLVQVFFKNTDNLKRLKKAEHNLL